MPIRCPICNGVLLSTIYNQEGGLKKSCRSHSHLLELYDRADDQLLIEVFLSPLSDFPGQCFQWAMEIKGLWIIDAKTKTALTFFTPNFSNYRKLIEKLKTYILFQ